MLYLNFSEKSLGLVSPSHFVWKMFLMLYSINWPNSLSDCLYFSRYWEILKIYRLNVQKGSLIHCNNVYSNDLLFSFPLNMQQGWKEIHKNYARNNFPNFVLLLFRNIKEKPYLIYVIWWNNHFLTQNRQWELYF